MAYQNSNDREFSSRNRNYRDLAYDSPRADDRLSAYDKRRYDLDEHYDRENKRTGGLFRNPKPGPTDDRSYAYDRSYANDRLYARDRNYENGRDNDDNPRHDFAGQHSYFPNHFDGQHYPYDTDSQFQEPSNWDRNAPPLGPHFGKGPKNFKRSDERLLEEINDRLTHDSHLDATNISVSVHDGIATLKGSLNSKHAKRRAEDIADSVVGVQDVMNEIRIIRTSGRGEELYGRPDGTGSRPQ